MTEDWMQELRVMTPKPVFPLAVSFGSEEHVVSLTFQADGRIDGDVETALSLMSSLRMMGGGSFEMATLAVLLRLERERRTRGDQA